jgi:hypothetical protein
MSYMSVERGSLGKPVHVAISTIKTPSAKDTILMTVAMVLPVAIAILMQNSALRQSLIMRTTHFGKELCRNQADLWNKLGDTCASAYNKAKL